VTTTLSIRVDEATQRELAELTRDGVSRNAAIVNAVHEAYRRSVYERIRREAEKLNNDPEYQAEVRAIREEFGHDDAW
jgi:hypothetical protein